MPRLKDRQRPIPSGEGFVFYEPHSKWKSKPWSTFEEIVQGVIEFRKANPHLTQQYGASIDHDEVSDEIDAYNAAMCQRMQWKDFILGGPDPFPKSQPPTVFKRLVAAAAEVKQLAQGYKAIKEWKISKKDAVPNPVAVGRASVCAGCPMNKQGDFTAFFTVPLSEAIRKDIQEAQGRGLTTPFDDVLNVCQACYCPLRLKVHIPIEFVGSVITPEIAAKLAEAPRCWILEELKLPR